MKSFVVVKSDKGKKNMNQDSLLVEHGKMNNDAILLAVCCDGVGGLEKGELASSCVVEAFQYWFEKSLVPSCGTMTIERIEKELMNVIKDINLKIVEHPIHMATTLSVLCIFKTDYIVAHVGDTRIYCLTDRILQLTEDDTLAKYKANFSEYSSFDIKKDASRHVLLKCIGMDVNMEPQIKRGKLVDCSFLLCSDGFYDKLEDREILEAFKKCRTKNDFKKESEKLIEIVKKRQEKDNISMIVIHVENG